MKIANNNASVIKRLANKSYKNNRSRNYLLIVSIAAVVTLLFSIISISYAQVDSEYLLAARRGGDLSTALLDRPTPEQYEKIKKLDYIDIVGKESYVNVGIKDGYDIFLGTVVDNVAYEELYIPAFTDVQGTYPEHEYEVMLPMRALDELGVKPEIGTVVSLDVVKEEGVQTTEEFILSGYFTEYVDPHASPAVAFFSEAYLEAANKSLENPDYLLMKQNDSLLFEETEEKLYNDIETIDDTQQFAAGDSIEYKTIENIYGDYDVMILLCVIIAVSVFLLINNIMQISLEKDVRELGLLRTIGTTKKQVFLIQQRQIIYITVFGLLIGSILAFLAIQLILPMFLRGLSSGSDVSVVDVLTFRVWLLFAVLGVAALIAVVSMLLPLTKINSISPKEALYFSQGKIKVSKKEIHAKKSVSIPKMAWRNITKNRGRFIKTVFSLFAASILCISSVMAIQILDYSNMYKDFPDFELSEDDYFNAYSTGPEDVFLNSEFVESIRNIDGITDVEASYEAYANIDLREEVWDPLMKAGEISLEEEPVRESGLRIVNDDEIEMFQKFVDDNNLDVDMDSFINGESVLNLQHHVFSEKMLEEAETTKGGTLTLYNEQGEEISKFNFDGYLDISTRGFPRFKNMSTNTSYAPYILISEKGFERSGAYKTINRFSINVEKDKVLEVHESLKKLLDARASEFIPEEMPQVGLFAKYIAEQEAVEYITSVRILLFSLSFILIGLAVLNYFNVMYTSLSSRRKELVVLESIGMTRGQLRTLLVSEGIQYGLVVTVLLASIGSGILYLVSNFIQAGQAKISFTYPTLAVVVLIVVVFIISILLPLLIYRRVEKQSIVERLSE